MAPAPTTRIRIVQFLFLLTERGQRPAKIRSPRPVRHSSCLPLFAERADFKFEGPGATRLLIELPIARCHRGRRHQQVRVVERFLAPELLAPLAYPGGIDA